MPDTACKWITVAAPQPMRSPPACHRLLRAVPPLAPHRALTKEMLRAMLSHPREWMTNPGVRCPPGPGLEQLTAPTPGVRHALHRASALTEQLTADVLDLPLKPLRVLYPQTHILPAGTSNRLGRLGLQRRVEAPHPGGVVEQCLTLHNPFTAQGHWYPHQLLFLPRTAPEHCRQNPYHTHPERLGAQSFPQPAPPALPPWQGPEALQQGPPLNTTTKVQQRGSNGPDGAELDCTNCGAVAWMASCRHLARDTTGLRQYRPTDARHWRPRSLPSPLVPWRRAQRNCCPTSPAQTRGPASQPQRTRRRHTSRRSSCTSSRRRYWQTAGRLLSTTTARRRSREAYKGCSATRPTRGTSHSASAPASGTPVAAHPLPGLSRGRRWCCRRRATRPSCTATPGGTGRTSWPGAAGLSGMVPPGKCIPAPAPCRLAAGPSQAYYMTADLWPLEVLLHNVSAPNKRQEWAGPTSPHWSGAPTRRSTYRPHGRETPSWPITHARQAATLAVAQRGQQNLQWVVCMFSPADAHIAVCDPERLPGPEAVVRVADCTRIIVKALLEGKHHPLLLQVRLKDNSNAAKPGVWPAAAHLADLELQLAVPTTVYHWLQAFHDLQWRGEPDHQIGATHWQEWLQADAQRDAIRSLGPAPATRALDAAAPGRALGPHTVPLADLPFNPAPEGAIQKSVPLLLARGATEPTKCPLCADKYYTSGALLEQLAWHAVHAAAPVGNKEAASIILQGRTRRSPWHTPYAWRPPPEAAGDTEGEEAPGAGGAAQQGSIPGGLAPLTPCGPRWERAPHTSWPWHTQGTRLLRRTQRQCRCWTADSRRTRRTTLYGSSHGTCATASSRRTGPSGASFGGAGGRRPVLTRSTSSLACYLGRGALPSCSREQKSPPGRRRCTWPRRFGTSVTPPSSAASGGDRTHLHLERGRSPHRGQQQVRVRARGAQFSRKLTPRSPRPWRSAPTEEASPSPTSTDRRQLAPHGREGRRSGPTYKCMPRRAASV